MNLLKSNESSTFAELNQSARLNKNDAIKKLFRAYNASFDVADWLRWTDFLRDTFQLILGQPMSDLSTELSSWLADILELMKWFQPLIPELNADSICIILLFTLDSVLGFLKFYRKWGKDNDLKRHLQDTILIYSFILKVINENVINLKVDSEREFSNLTKLIATLCELGEQASPVDIKTILETWKCVAKITAQCAKYKWASSFDETTANQKPKTDWAERPFKYLLKEVSRNLTVIYNEDTLNQPIEQVEKYLRVTNFYLKLLQMLTADFRHAEFPTTREFFEVLILSISLPKYLVCTQIAKIVQKYVLNVLIDVLKYVYKNNFIRELLLSHLQECKDGVYVVLARKFLRTSVSGRDCKFIDCNVKTFVIIFQHLVEDLAKFSDPDEYNVIIELYAALTILSETPALKEYFRNNVLSGDFATAHASSEVLLIVFRWFFDRTQTPADALREFRYWRHCNESFALISGNTRQLHIQRLLRHTFKLCKSSTSIPKNELWDQYPEWQLTLKNYRFFLAVGLATTSSTESKLQTLIVRLSDELFQLITKCDTTGCSVDDYYKMVINTELLSTANVTHKKELVTQLFQLVTGLYSNSNLRIQDFTRILNAFHNLAASYSNSLDESTLQHIIDCIKNRRGCHSSVTLFEINFLSSCCNNVSPKLQDSAKNILTQLNSINGKPNGNVNLIAPFQMLKEIYRQLSAAPCHVCDVKNTTIQKRQRQNVDEDDEGPSLKIIVNDILKNSHNIVNLSTQLDSVDFNVLNCAVNNLKFVLGKKQ